MKYRIATKDDFEACAECVASTGYYSPVDFNDTGGTILLAENEKGVQGIVWATRAGSIAYTDFLAVRPEYKGTGLGIRLVTRGAAILQKMGVRQIRSYVHMSNTGALKMNGRLGAIMDSPYALAIFAV